MNNFILKLQNEQELRILPFENGDLFKEYYNYYFDDIGGFFLPKNTNITFTTRLQRIIVYFFIVKYKEEYYIIKTGRKIREKIDYYFSDDSGQTFYSPEHLINCSIMIKINIQQVGAFPDYDKSYVYQLAQRFEMEHHIDDFYNAPKYVNLLKNFDNYINSMMLHNKPKQIEFLELHGVFKDNYHHLLRNLKINQFRNNKINTTKIKLWNQVINMIDENAKENKRIEDIGYLKDDGEGEEVHQFMVDGYLFEVKLKDKI